MTSLLASMNRGVCESSRGALVRILCSVVAFEDETVATEVTPQALGGSGTNPGFAIALMDGEASGNAWNSCPEPLRSFGGSYAGVSPYTHIRWRSASMHPGFYR